MKIRCLLPILVLAAQTAGAEKKDKAQSTVPFPKDKPALTLEIPNTFAVDATAERLIVKTRKERKSFFCLAAIPAGDGVTNEATAKVWLPKKAEALLKTIGIKGATSFHGVVDHIADIAGHKSFEIQYAGGGLDELQICVFTPDGKNYFYAYFQRRDEDMGETPQDLDAGLDAFWQRELLNSIKVAK